MIGVIIGVAAVVVLVAIGTGAKNEVETQVEGLGSNLILVVPGRLEADSGPTVSRLQLDDVETLARVVGDPQPRDHDGDQWGDGHVGSPRIVRHRPGHHADVPGSVRPPADPRPLPQRRRRGHSAADRRARLAGRAGSLSRRGSARPTGHPRGRTVPRHRRVRGDRRGVRLQPRHRGARAGNRSAATARCRPHRRACGQGPVRPTASRTFRIGW